MPYHFIPENAGDWLGWGMTALCAVAAILYYRGRDNETAAGWAITAVFFLLFAIAGSPHP